MATTEIPHLIVLLFPQNSHLLGGMSLKNPEHSLPFLILSMHLGSFGTIDRSEHTTETIQQVKSIEVHVAGRFGLRSEQWTDPGALFCI